MLPAGKIFILGDTREGTDPSAICLVITHSFRDAPCTWNIIRIASEYAYFHCAHRLCKPPSPHGSNKRTNFPNEHLLLMGKNKNTFGLNRKPMIWNNNGDLTAHRYCMTLEFLIPVSFGARVGTSILDSEISFVLATSHPNLFPTSMARQGAERMPKLPPTDLYGHRELALSLVERLISDRTTHLIGIKLCVDDEFLFKSRVSSKTPLIWRENSSSTVACAILNPGKNSILTNSPANCGLRY